MTSGCRRTAVQFQPMQVSMDSSLGLQEVEVPRISRQSAYEGGKVVSPTYRPSLPPHPKRHPWYSFLLEAESILGPASCRKEEVN